MKDDIEIAKSCYALLKGDNVKKSIPPKYEWVGGDYRYILDATDNPQGWKDWAIVIDTKAVKDES